MKKVFDGVSMFFLALIFLIAVTFSNLNAQSRIMEDIGSSNNATQTADNGPDYTLIYLGAGLVLGFVVYKVFIAKPDPDEKTNDKEKKSEDKPKSLAQEIQEYQSETPVNLHMGIQNNRYMGNQKQFMVGLSFKL